MKETTKIKYRKDAATFFSKHFSTEQPTAGKIAAKLIEVATDYRPDSWRNLRNAIRLQQEEAGYSKAAKQLAELKNPTTSKGSTLKIKTGRVKTTRVNNADFNVIAKALAGATKEVRAAILIAYLTGCRPAEMSDMRRLSDGSFLITSSKKTEDGLRGLDRKIKVKNSTLLAQEVRVLRGVSVQDMKRINNNVYTFMKRTFPKRTASTRPNLYSFRHQMASNLKAAKTDLKTMSYLMGHQVTQSIERYGNPRSGTGAHGVEPAESAKKIDGLVFDNKAINTARPSRISPVSPANPSNSLGM